METLPLHAPRTPIDYNPNTDFMATYLHNLRRVPGPAPKPVEIKPFGNAGTNDVIRPPKPTEFNFRVVRNSRHCANAADVEDAICSFYLKNETLGSISSRMTYQRPAIYKWIKGETNLALDVMKKNNIIAFSGLLKSNLTYTEISK